ncbi:tyrosine-type recombinase/integrase [Endozoicomonas acroporae]|uniref:tyrosine-type recombinase/integrase n=1 Tax=Endozoicomonas acroporae TaxID=1701104 RepID=UPI003D7A5ADE
MATLKPFDLDNIKYRLRESVGSRGEGTLLFEKRPSGSIEAYYLYKQEGKEFKIKIGPYKATRASHGYKLAECRDKAQELARLRRECGGDLKGYLETQEREREKLYIEEQRQQEIEALQGSLKDLFDSYVASLHRKGRKTAYQVEKSLERHVLKPFPKLATEKARNITVDDVVSIIRRMIKKGITTSSNRLRSFLHAAYEFGMKADNDPREQVIHGKRFCIEYNPVSAVPRQPDFERVRKRYLSHEEVKRLWHDFMTLLPNVNPVFGLLVRFMLATGGNRPRQLLRCTWSDFDFNRRTFTFVEWKGKNATPKDRVMPLTPRAIEILDELKKISGSFEWPFCINGKVPVRIGTLSNRVQDYCRALEAEAKAKGQTPPEYFVPKDIRTTATNLLIECRVPKEQRFLIQSREDGSVESKHYDHSDRLPEKREALKQYDTFLGKVINGEVSKLVDLDEYRQQIK